MNRSSPFLSANKAGLISIAMLRKSSQCGTNSTSYSSDERSSRNCC